jgi:RND superfamily putative drug exporter
MKSLATWCVRHRLIVLLIWLAVLVGTMTTANVVGSNYQSSFSLPNTESTEALNLLQAAAPQNSGDTERIVFEVPAGQSVTDPATQAAVTTMLDKIAKFPTVVSVLSPYEPAGSTQISKDGRVAYATVNLSKGSFTYSQATAEKFVTLAQTADGHGLTVAVSGQVASQAARPSIGGTLPGVILAGIVLLIVFGSLYAMALPIVSALASLGTAIALVGLLSHWIDMPTFSTELVLLIGLGVGVDYALFIVTRYRQGLVAGNSVEEAIVTAVNTSGRAVLFAGIIVCIALLGMFALGVSFLYGLAIASALGVALTMIAALTLLPALLSFIGPRVLSRKQKRDLKENGPKIVGLGTKGFWPRWADFMRRRPLIPAVVALTIVALLAVPFFSMRLGHGDAGNDPTGTTTRQAYDMLAAGFGPGFNGPLQLVSVTKTSDPQELAAVNKAVEAVKAAPGVAAVSPTINIPGKDPNTTVSLTNVFPTGSPQAASTTDLINYLRSTTLPQSLHGTGVTILVGGVTAIFADFAHVLSSKLPLFVGLVVLLSFLLLAMVFRSLVIPLTAAVMNLLSIAAAFGILVAVFQHGVAGSIFGVARPGPIETFIPVMMFAILFGLSMDYEVFLVTRIHEEWLKTGDNTTAVRNGLAATGKTISAAACIMVLVFGSFILGGVLVIKEFGLGLAAGVLVDAIIIRMAIVPSVMQLLGKSNWWFPKWLDRLLPKLAVEAEPQEPEKIPVSV